MSQLGHQSGSCIKNEPEIYTRNNRNTERPQKKNQKYKKIYIFDGITGLARLNYTINT